MRFVSRIGNILQHNLRHVKKNVFDEDCFLDTYETELRSVSNIKVHLSIYVCTQRNGLVHD